MFKRYWWMFLAMVPVGVLGCFLIAAIVTFVTPSIYESTAVIEISDRRPRVDGMRPKEPRSEVFFQTEIKKITSWIPLNHAIKALDLSNRWGLDHETTLKVLKTTVKPQQIPGTDLVSITVRHTNREDARNIAAEVTRAYINYRIELAEEPLIEMVGEMQKIVRNQEDAVAEKRKTMNLISRRDDAASGESQDLIDARRDYELELAVLQNTKLKLIGLEFEKNSTEIGLVIVHDKPVIPDTPVSPNVTRNLVAGLVGGFFLSPFLALPLMWMLNRKHENRFEAAVPPDDISASLPDCY